MEQTVINTDIGIHTYSGLLTGYGMQKCRIARIAVQRHKMIGLGRKGSICAYERAIRNQTYYDYIPLHLFRV